MKRTISITSGKGSVNHNSRKFHAKNTDPERSCLNVHYMNDNIRDVYHELFDDALVRYNEKQKRNDRRIEDYYEKIASGEQEKTFHEIIKGTHEKHLSVLDFEKKERAREVAELEIKKEELEAENASFSEINEVLHEQLIAVDDEIHNMQESIVQSKEEAEKARKQADRYQKRMNELAPMVKNMEQFAIDFSEDPDRVLPDAGTLESGRSYRDKKAKPTVQKMVKVMRSVYSAYLHVSRKYDNLKQRHDQMDERADNLSERFHVIYAENQRLKEVERDFDRLKSVLGNDKVDSIMLMERQREQTLKEQKQAERNKYYREVR